jgi:hypothetical protein
MNNENVMSKYKTLVIIGNMNNENVMSKYKTLVIIGNIYREKKTICSILFRQPLTLLHPIQLASQ